LLAIAEGLAGDVLALGAVVRNHDADVADGDQCFRSHLNRGEPAIDKKRAVSQDLQLFAAATAKRDAYLKMLSAGSSRYGYDMLKEAGVDMATSAPFAAAMKDMNATIDAMEKILDKRKP